MLAAPLAHYPCKRLLIQHADSQVWTGTAQLRWLSLLCSVLQELNFAGLELGAAGLEYLLGALMETLAANKFPALRFLTISGSQVMLPPGPLMVPSLEHLALEELYSLTSPLHCPQLSHLTVRTCSSIGGSLLTAAPSGLLLCQQLRVLHLEMQVSLPPNDDCLSWTHSDQLVFWSRA